MDHNFLYKIIQLENTSYKQLLDLLQLKEELQLLKELIKSKIENL